MQISPEKAKEFAVRYFVGDRFNCAEATLQGLLAAQGRWHDSVPRIATGFGGGMGGCGETCGALIGAIMAIGLKHGRSKGSDLERKTRTGGLVAELLRAFRAEFGSVRCIELTGVDMSTPEGTAEAQARRLHDDFCPKFVAFAAEKTAELLNR